MIPYKSSAACREFVQEWDECYYYFPVAQAADLVGGVTHFPRSSGKKLRPFVKLCCVLFVLLLNNSICDHFSVLCRFWILQSLMYSHRLCNITLGDL